MWERGGRGREQRRKVGTGGGRKAWTVESIRALLGDRVECLINDRLSHQFSFWSRPLPIRLSVLVPPSYSQLVSCPSYRTKVPLWYMSFSLVLWGGVSSTLNSFPRVLIHNSSFLHRYLGHSGWTHDARVVTPLLRVAIGANMHAHLHFLIPSPSHPLCSHSETHFLS